MSGASRSSGWTEAIELGLGFSADARFADRWHVIRYEDLTADRAGDLAMLFGFLGLDTDRTTLDDIGAATDISRQHGAGDGEHVRTGAVGDWRIYFDARERALFQLLAGDGFRRAGYR